MRLAVALAPALALAPMLLLLSACASAPPAPAASAAATTAAAPAAAAQAAPAVEMAETPYTAAQIREATPAGRRIVLRVEEPGKPNLKRVLEFAAPSASGVDVRASTLDEAGKVVETSNDHATWEELRSHAAFPKGKVDIKHRTVSVPLGTLMCTVYTVTGDGPEPEVTTFYFAETLPGPPVFYYVEKGGKRLRATTMESSSGK